MRTHSVGLVCITGFTGHYACISMNATSGNTVHCVLSFKILKILLKNMLAAIRT